MHEQQAPHGAHGPPPPTAHAPSSSRMLASYFTDIEQLLDDQSWDAALREACDLPRIAMALSDPQLRCSGEDVATWCRQWLRPATGEGDAGLTAHHAAVGDAHAVPTRALRRLQLRRHVRSRPRGFRREHEAGLEREAAETVATARALVAAARGWYARSGCHDPTVQVNLARLAVLR